MGAFFYNPQTNFTAGEWSDDMAGRSDLAKFRNASRTIENFLPTPQGRLLTTPGTRFVAKARYADKKCVLYPFIFSNTDALPWLVSLMAIPLTADDKRKKTATEEFVAILGQAQSIDSYQGSFELFQFNELIEQR